MSLPAKKMDESLINFYDEQILTHADAVYRFGFALTLSLDGAVTCTELTFKEATSSLEHLYREVTRNGVSPIVFLVTECWKAFQGQNGGAFRDGHSKVEGALKPLAVEERAVLVAVDVLGLSSTEAKSVFGWDEVQLRGRLATARRHIMQGSIDF